LNALAEELDVEIIEEKHLTNPEAYALLKKALERILKSEATLPPLLAKTLEYLKKFSKTSPEAAAALREKLAVYGLKEETIVMIVNICPETLDELRPLLELEEKFIETEKATEILNIVKEYCGKLPEE